MQYALLIYRNEELVADATQADAEKMMAAYMAYAEAMKQAGVIRSGERLRPAGDAATVRVAGGKSKVVNGPYADTKEQLGGFFVIETKDLDEAISWAARCPGAQVGTIEVRPLWPM